MADVMRTARREAGAANIPGEVRLSDWDLLEALVAVELREKYAKEAFMELLNYGHLVRDTEEDREGQEQT
jgi:hypothetical protein